VKACAVVPAYNEAGRISRVLDTLHASPSVTEIVVVDDGSADDTAAVVQAHPAAVAGKLRLIQHNPNRGKGAAMVTGADAATADVVVFLDADLIGLTPAHVDALVQPVLSGKVAMALGVFRGGLRSWPRTSADSARSAAMFFSPSPACPSPVTASNLLSQVLLSKKVCRCAVSYLPM
jgi:glycosyltransferase involved in cell wall biosynthesis